MSEKLKPCPFCGGEAEKPYKSDVKCNNRMCPAYYFVTWMPAKELRQSYKYDKTCSTCRYLDENRDCVLGIRCVNYTLWQGKIL